MIKPHLTTMYFIYVIENLLDGKMYIGQTIDPARRRRGHFSPSSKCPYISNAIQKYGIGNFDFRLLEECTTLEDANTQEKYWIKELASLAPHGYNLREGGDAGGLPSQETIEKIRLANTGKKQTEEQKEKRAASHRGRKNTPETIEKMSKAARNRPPEKCSMFGKKHSVETKRRMSLSATKMYCKRGHPLDGPNSDVWISKEGKRDCRACNRIRRQAV